MAEPYFDDGIVQLWLGDCRELDAWLAADVLVTDPPYGISYESGSRRDELAKSILGDEDTTARDEVLMMWGDRPAIVFGTWRIPRPEGVRARLIWDTKGALGMGDLRIPWKPSDQEIYILGPAEGFRGARTTNVLSIAPVQSTAKNGRLHPHEKPLRLMDELIAKTVGGIIADPFAGSGSTLVSAQRMGRRAVGVEKDERYAETIAKRLQQPALVVLESQDLAEQGRRLASEREDLVAAGVDPAQLEVPLHPKSGVSG